MLLLSSCSKETIAYETVLSEFSQYQNTNDTVLFLDPYLYFNDYRINLDDFFPHRESPKDFIIEDATLLNDQIYFTVLIKEDRSWSTILYRCGLRGENLEEVFGKANHGKSGDSKIIDGTVYYFKYNDANKVDEISSFYNIRTAQYGDVSELGFSNINDFLKNYGNYRVEKMEKTFIVTDKRSQENRIIDDAFLRTTEYYQSLNKFGYGCAWYEILDGKVLLIYYLDIPSESSWWVVFPVPPPVVVFEYDFEQNELIFKSTHDPFQYESCIVRHNIVFDQTK